MIPKRSRPKDSPLCKRPPACCIRWSKNDKLGNWHSLGFSPLHIAVVTRAPRFSLYCLAKSGFANTKSRDGFTALHLATILTPDYDTVSAIIKGGAHLNVMDDLHRTALDFAAYLNHRDAINAIIDSSHNSLMKAFKDDFLAVPFERILPHCTLLFCRPYGTKREPDWPFSIKHEGEYFINPARRIFALAGQGYTAIHFAMASPIPKICLQCLPEWKPRDHEHAYSPEDAAAANEEHESRLQAHSEEFITHIIAGMRVITTLQGPEGIHFLKYGNWSHSYSMSSLPDLHRELQEYTAWFVNLPDIDGKTPMDYAIIRKDLTSLDQLNLIMQVKGWGGMATEDFQRISSTEHRKEHIDAKFKDFEIHTRVYEELLKPTESWIEPLTFRNVTPKSLDNHHPQLPKGSPMKATKELIEDAANHGLHVAIMLSRNVSAREKLLELTECNEKEKRVLSFEVSTMPLI